MNHKIFFKSTFNRKVYTKLNYSSDVFFIKLLRKGINLADLSAQEHTYILRNARKSIGNGLLEITDNRLKLTRQGLFVSDEVMSDLIWID